MAGFVYPIATTVTIGGVTDFPISSWTINQGMYGSIGSVEIESSIAQMRDQGVNFNQMIHDTPVVPIEIWVRTSLNNELIFRGTFDYASLRFNQDTVSIFGRDPAGEMLDMRMSLADIATDNQTAADLVRQIAEKFDIPIRVEGVSRVNIGYGYRGEYKFSQSPQPAWNIIQYLARKSESDVYMQPDGTLVFGNSIKHDTLTCTWKPAAKQLYDDPTLIPIKVLDIMHSPRRHKTFAVVLTNYSSEDAREKIQEATHFGHSEDVAGLLFEEPLRTYLINTGVMSADNAKVVTPAVIASGKFYTYYLHRQGLTDEQALQETNNFIRDMARKEYVVTVVIDGLASLRPNTRLTLQENSPGELLGYANAGLIVTAIRHRYQIPAGGARAAEGFVTEVIANALPKEAIGGPTI